MGRLQREKGKRGEREVVKILNAAGIKAKRRLSVLGDATDCASDIELLDNPNIIIDVKYRNKIFVKTFKEVEEKLKTANGIVVTCWRQTGDRTWRITMKLNDWIKMLYCNKKQ